MQALVEAGLVGVQSSWCYLVPRQDSGCCFFWWSRWPARTVQTVHRENAYLGCNADEVVRSASAVSSCRRVIRVASGVADMFGGNGQLGLVRM